MTEAEPNPFFTQYLVSRRLRSKRARNPFYGDLFDCDLGLAERVERWLAREVLEARWEMHFHVTLFLHDSSSKPRAI